MCVIKTLQLIFRDDNNDNMTNNIPAQHIKILVCCIEAFKTKRISHRRQKYKYNIYDIRTASVV